MAVDAGSEPRATEPVIEALYDLPLGGDWREVQTALCNFWQRSGDHPDPSEVAILERHFDRAMAFLERLPPHEHRWRNELFRIPVPACILDRDGSIVEANAAGLRHLGLDQDQASHFPAETRDRIRAALRDLEHRKMAATSVMGCDGDALNLFISRLPEKVHAGSALHIAVMVTREIPAHGLKILAETYALTRAEAELCFNLASGNSLDDVAQQSSVKKTTLRTHLSNTFSKLGVSSQPELVAVVLHSVFATAHLAPPSEPPGLTPYLDPEIHGHPRFIKLTLPDGRCLGCFEYGDPDGIPAIYLHGSLDAGLFMKGQKLHGNGVRLFAVERGGVGESTPNPDPSPVAYARDIMCLVEDLGLEEFAVIGRSMGSWDAISLALEAGPRMRLLTLVSGRLPVQRQEQHQHDSFYQSLYSSIWHSNTMGRLMLRMMLLQLMVRGPEYFIGRESPVGLEARLDEDPLYARHMRAIWLRAGFGGTEPTHNHMRLYRDPVPQPPWLGFASPTLLIHGIEDRVVPHERIIEQTASFENRSVKLMPRVGHRLVHLAMGEVLRTVRSEWDNVRSTGPPR